MAVVVVLIVIALAQRQWSTALLPAFGTSNAELAEAPVAADLVQHIEVLEAAAKPAPAHDRATAIAARTSAEPLPSLDVPVAGILDALEARAQQGDSAAACRISAELAACDRVLGADPAARERAMAARIARAPEVGGAADRRIEEIARAIELEAQLVERCADVPVHWFSRRPHLDLRAAQLGDLDAALRFVSGDGMSAGELVREPHLAALYRANAWPLFLQLIEAGDMYAPMLWAAAASDVRQEHLLSAVMPQEWKRRGAVARALARRVLEPAMAAGLAIVDEEHLVSPQGQAEAAALFEARFAPSARFTVQREAVVEQGIRPAWPERCESLR